MPRRPWPVDVFLGPLCSQWYTTLAQSETKRKIDSMLDTLRERWDAGDHLRRTQWPSHPAYANITNLWKYDIDRGMRATYTIRVPTGAERIVLEVIEVFLDHKDYDKRLGYRGS